MGIEKDYLMRQLLQLFEVFQKILRFRKSEEKENAEKEIAQFYTMLKIEKNIRNMSIEELLVYLETTLNYSWEQMELIAFVMKEQGELENNEDNKLDFFSKSFFVLTKVERESRNFSYERQIKLAELGDILKN